MLKMQFVQEGFFFDFLLPFFKKKKIRLPNIVNTLRKPENIYNWTTNL